MKKKKNISHTKKDISHTPTKKNIKRGDKNILSTIIVSSLFVLSIHARNLIRTHLKHNMSAAEVQGKQQENLKDHTTFVATPMWESVDSGGQRVLKFLGIDCATARCRHCLQKVPHDHENALKTEGDDENEAKENEASLPTTPRTPCDSHSEWTKTFEMQRRNMKSANIPKNDEEYQKSVFSPTDESSTRLYAEMDALETEAVINENLVSGAVKNAVKH